MCFMNIGCPKCGKTSTLESFTERPISGYLPPGQFQCPLCGYAFQRREVEPGKIIVSAGVIISLPGKIELVPCEAVL